MCRTSSGFGMVESKRWLMSWEGLPSNRFAADSRNIRRRTSLRMTIRRNTCARPWHQRSSTPFFSRRDRRVATMVRVSDLLPDLTAGSLPTLPEHVENSQLQLGEPNVFVHSSPWVAPTASGSESESGTRVTEDYLSVRARTSKTRCSQLQPEVQQRQASSAAPTVRSLPLRTKGVWSRSGSSSSNSSQRASP
jgi:hypothetical protein